MHPAILSNGLSEWLVPFRFSVIDPKDSDEAKRFETVLIVWLSMNQGRAIPLN